MKKGLEFFGLSFGRTELKIIATCLLVVMIIFGTLGFMASAPNDEETSEFLLSEMETQVVVIDENAVMRELAATPTKAPTPVVKPKVKATPKAKNVSVASKKSERKYFDISLSRAEQDQIYYWASQYGLDPAIVFAVCYRESRFDKFADNGLAAGIMQINRCNWQKYGLNSKNVFSVAENVRVGCQILSELLDKYSDIHMALVAYNNGPTGARRQFFSKGVYTSSYSRGVVAKSAEYRR